MSLIVCLASPPTYADPGWLAVEEGFVAPTDGYFGDVETGRRTLDELQINQGKLDARHDALLTVSTDVSTTQTDIEAELANLNAAFDAERAEWAKQQRALKRRHMFTILGIALGGGVIIWIAD